MDKTKGVQQQETVRDHRKRLTVTLVVSEIIFKIYEYNTQPRDGTRGPLETQKEEENVPDLSPSDTGSQWSCSGSVLEKPKPDFSTSSGMGCRQN